MIREEGTTEWRELAPEAVAEGKGYEVLGAGGRVFKATASVHKGAPVFTIELEEGDTGGE
jgi:hypothetical protein